MTATFPNKTGLGLAEDTTASIICSQKDFISLAVCAFSFHLCHQSMMLWNRTYLLQACIYPLLLELLVSTTADSLFIALIWKKPLSVVTFQCVLSVAPCLQKKIKITPLPHEYGELHVSHLACL